MVPGAKVEVEGSITIYYGQPEIDRGYKLTVLEEAPEGGFDYSEAADAFIPEIVWSSVNDPKSYGRILTVTGKVTEGQYGDYKNLELTDETTNTKIMIYHDSEEGFIDAITASKDKYVTARLSLTISTLPIKFGAYSDMPAPLRKQRLFSIPMRTKFI